MREALMHHLTLTGIEQAVSRLTSHLKASAPKLKHGATAMRHWMILQGEIALGQVGNGERQRPCARCRPPTFGNVYSPKTSQSAQANQRIRAKILESLALPRGLEPLFSP